MPAPYDNPQYFFKSGSTDRRGVKYYKAQDVTEVWDDKQNSQGGPVQGNQLNTKCFQLEQQNYQKDSNPGWQVPAKPSGKKAKLKKAKLAANRRPRRKKK
jgi:hypothetical protein